VWRARAAGGAEPPPAAVDGVTDGVLHALP
jgi:hypothetical protein